MKKLLVWLELINPIEIVLIALFLGCLTIWVYLFTHHEVVL